MIDIVSNPEMKQWDQYAAKHVAAKYSHLFAWGENLASTYNLPIFRLAAIRRQTNKMSGILPLILFAPPGKSKRLISLPYTDSAGMLVDDWQSGRRLLFAAIALANECGAEHVELRQDGALHTFFQQEKTFGAWNSTPYNFKTGLLRELPGTVDDLWSDLSSKVRNQIRKARRCGCTMKAGEADLIDNFYAVFSENMRDLGSPVHGIQLFRNLLDSDSLRTGIIVIYQQTIPVAAAVVLIHNGTAYNPWASSLRSHRPTCPNMLLYWSMLEYAIHNRCKWFDFGRSSPGAPTCRFKLQWGARMESLVWHVFSQKHNSWDPHNESLEYESWKSMTLERSRQHGPDIRRWISL